MILLLQTTGCDGNSQTWCFIWWLLGAFLLGLLLSWLLKKLFGSNDDGDWKSKYDALDVKYNRLHSSNNQLQKDYDECMNRKPAAASAPKKKSSSTSTKSKSSASSASTSTGSSSTSSTSSSAGIAASIAAAAATPYTGVKDDLTKVEGIGPKINELLNGGGIYTYKHLADADASYIRGILDLAGPAYKVHDPGTWPKQSELADAGKWEELKKWQSELDGGK